MNRTRMFLLIGLLSLGNMLCVAHGKAATPPTETGRRSVDLATSADVDFAVKLYGQLSREKDYRNRNLFFSPYSIFSALSMTAEGARGETAAEMGQTLCFPAAAKNTGPDAAERPWDMGVLHAGIAALDRRYNAPKRPYMLRLANALWGERSHPFLQSYIDTIGRFYKTDGLFNVDFSNNHEAARLRINRWVEKQTEGKIKNLIPRGPIDEATRLVLTNAIYFNGTWRDAFDEEYTEPADFTVPSGKKTQVPMMFHLKDHRYTEDGSLQIVELAYKGDDLSMLAVLPKDAAGLAELERSLSHERIERWRAGLRSRKVEVHLPKFKLEMSFELKSVLTALGMKQAFTGSADFSGIDGMANYLYISAVIHKSFVDVNEVGTEAAAATAVITGKTGPPPPSAKPVEFRADHPFLFVICDNSSGNILFLGRMMNPAE